ncbi:MAG: hypothetical protein MUC28_03195 [Planctomycetes bacterium]|jgi:hypothetical protein|nr:hypothetical protein [Planctomycetota bacterium]
MLDKTIWQSIDNNSTGYLGKRRNEEWAKRDEMYGQGNWRMAWLVGDNLLEYADVCQLYGQAYFEYFKMRPELMEYLVKIASDIYDDDPTNVEAGTDYSVRGEVKTHIHDTAIRQCVNRLGLKFTGKLLLQISTQAGEHPLSFALSPGQVPFHKKEYLSSPDNLEEVTRDAWWLPGSVEDFYQRAKRLCVKKEVLDKMQTN